MPNVVTNILTLTGSSEEIAAFRAAVVRPDENGAFCLDYQAIIPVDAPFTVGCAARKAAWGSHFNSWGGRWVETSATEASLVFMSAWEPPVSVLQELASLPVAAGLQMRLASYDEWHGNGGWIGCNKGGPFSAHPVLRDHPDLETMISKVMTPYTPAKIYASLDRISALVTA